VTTAQATDVAERFLEALSHRDFDALAATFAENGRLRGLVPSALREEEGGEAIAARFRLWFGDVEDFELVGSGTSPLADIVRLYWRVRHSDPEAGLTTVEQTAYAEVDGDRFAWMNLVCSGHRPVGG